MRTPTLDLDTSVLGGYFDAEWQQPTRELWRQMEAGLWRFACSDVTAREIDRAPEHVRNLNPFASCDIFCKAINLRFRN